MAGHPGIMRRALRSIHGIEESNPELLVAEDRNLFDEMADWEIEQCEEFPLFSEKLEEML